MDSNTIVFKHNKNKQFTNSRYYREHASWRIHIIKKSMNMLEISWHTRTALWFLTCSVAACFSVSFLTGSYMVYIGQGHNRLPHITTPFGNPSISIYSMFIIFRIIATVRKPSSHLMLIGFFHPAKQPLKSHVMFSPWDSSQQEMLLPTSKALKSSRTTNTTDKTPTSHQASHPNFLHKHPYAKPIDPTHQKHNSAQDKWTWDHESVFFCTM